MAKLCNFVYCVNAERILDASGKGEVINAMGVMPILTPEFVPGSFSFSIVFSIVGIDITKDNIIKIIFSEYNGRELINSNDILIPASVSDAGSASIPIEFKGLNLSMDFRNVVFESEGIYNTTIKINNETFSDNKIYVKGRRQV